MLVGSPVWIRNPEFKDPSVDDLWISSNVESTELIRADAMKVKVNINGREHNVMVENGSTENYHIKIRNERQILDVDDLLEAHSLNEPEILLLLKRRYDVGKQFTFLGPILLSINPIFRPDFNETKNKILDSQRLLNSFVQHIVRDSFSLAYQGNVSHSILISGESGSGKSECFKQILGSFPFLQITKKDTGTLLGEEPAQLTSTFSTPIKSSPLTNAAPKTAIQVNQDFINLLTNVNRILDSFGNAMTLNTDNSSRYGKLCKLSIANEGDIAGGQISTYLLEISRVTKQEIEERNFNIFYELISGINKSEYHSWGISSAKEFNYTNQGGPAVSASSTEDKDSYQDLLDCFHFLKFETKKVNEIMLIITCLLHIGNISFEENHHDINGRLNISNMEHIILLSRLLGLSRDELVLLLTTKSFLSPNGEKIDVNLSKEFAANYRDSIAKATYRLLFDWIVGELNQRIERNTYIPYQMQIKLSSQAKNSLSILDIFGFDSFPYNALDQLCINYANEALQLQFNQYIHSQIQLIYQSEEINFEGQFSFNDNSEIIELIGSGIFNILDDQCRLPHPTDKRLVAQLYKEFISPNALNIYTGPASSVPNYLKYNNLFQANKFQQNKNQFSIQHFAGTVEYTVTDFIERNNDLIPPELFQTIGNSTTNELLALLYKNKLIQQNLENTAKQARRQSITFSKFTSFVTNYKNEVQSLIKELDQSHPHYIRCLKPLGRELFVSKSMINSPLSPKTTQKYFSQHKISEQLRYSGLLEIIRISKSKMSYKDFYQRYRNIILLLPREVFLPILLRWPKILPSIQEYRRVSRELYHFLSKPIQELTTPRTSPKPSISKGKKFFPPHKHHKSRIQMLFERLEPELWALMNQKGLIPNTNQELLKDDPKLLATGIQFGKTNLFILQNELDCLEMIYAKLQYILVCVIQSWFRMKYSQNTYNKWHISSIIIQSNYRKYVAMMKYKQLRKAVSLIQGRYRWKRRVKAVIKIQSVFRMHFQFIFYLTYRKMIYYLRDKVYPDYEKAYNMRKKRRLFLDSQFISLNSTKKTSKDIILGHSYTISHWEKRLKCQKESQNFVKEYVDLINSGSKFKKIENTAIMSTSIKASAGKDLKEITLHNSTSIPHTFPEILKALYLEGTKLPNRSKACKKLVKYIQQTQSGSLLLQLDSLDPFSLSWKNIINRFLPSPRKKQMNSSSATLISSQVSTKQQGGSSYVTSDHQIFEKILLLLHRYNKLEKLLYSELTDLLKAMKSNIVNITESIPFVEAYKNIILLIKELIKYYHQFMDSFVKEYGLSSTYALAFSKPDEYLKALRRMILLDRKYDQNISAMQTTQDTALLPMPSNTHSGSERIANRYTEIDSLPIVWKDFTKGIPIKKFPRYKSNTLMKLRLVERERSIDSNRTVRVIVKHDLGFQYMPYKPGIMYAMNSFLYLLSGKLLTGVQLMKICGSLQNTGQEAYYLVMRNLVTTSLVDILYDPIRIENIQSSSFSSVFLTCCIMGLTNLHPHHLFVKEEKDSNIVNFDDPSICLTYFNNDSLLSKYFLDFQNIQSFKVDSENINVLFFFPQMDEPIDLELTDILTSTPFISEEIILNWLRDLHDQNNVFSNCLPNEIDKQALDLPISFSKTKIFELYKRIKHVCAQLSEPQTNNYRLTHHDILKSFYPEIADYYYNARSSPIHALKEGIRVTHEHETYLSYAYLYHQAMASFKADSIPIPKKKGDSRELVQPSKIPFAPRKVSFGHFFSRPGSSSYDLNANQSRDEMENGFGDFLPSKQSISKTKKSSIKDPKKTESVGRKVSFLAPKKIDTTQFSSKNDSSTSQQSILSRKTSVGFDYNEIYESESVKRKSFNYGRSFFQNENSTGSKSLKNVQSAYLDYGELYDKQDDADDIDASIDSYHLPSKKSASVKLDFDDIYEIEAQENSNINEVDDSSNDDSTDLEYQKEIMEAAAKGLGGRKASMTRRLFAKDPAFRPKSPLLANRKFGNPNKQSPPVIKEPIEEDFGYDHIGESQDTEDEDLILVSPDELTNEGGNGGFGRKLMSFRYSRNFFAFKNDNGTTISRNIDQRRNQNSPHLKVSNEVTKKNSFFQPKTVSEPIKGKTKNYPKLTKKLTTLAKSDIQTKESPLSNQIQRTLSRETSTDSLLNSKQPMIRAISRRASYSLKNVSKDPSDSLSFIPRVASFNIKGKYDDEDEDDDEDKIRAGGMFLPDQNDDISEILKYIILMLAFRHYQQLYPNQNKRNQLITHRFFRFLGLHLGSLLTTINLKNIQEQQLKNMFQPWLAVKSIDPIQSDDNSNPPFSLLTNSLCLEFDDKNDLESLVSSFLLYRIKRDLGLNVELIFLEPNGQIPAKNQNMPSNHPIPLAKSRSWVASFLLSRSNSTLLDNSEAPIARQGSFALSPSVDENFNSSNGINPLVSNKASIFRRSSLSNSTINLAPSYDNPMAKTKSNDEMLLGGMDNPLRRRSVLSPTRSKSNDEELLGGMTNPLRRRVPSVASPTPQAASLLANAPWKYQTLEDNTLQHILDYELTYYPRHSNPNILQTKSFDNAEERAFTHFDLQHDDLDSDLDIIEEGNDEDEQTYEEKYNQRKEEKKKLADKEREIMQIMIKNVNILNSVDLKTTQRHVQILQRLLHQLFLHEKDYNQEEQMTEFIQNAQTIQDISEFITLLLEFPGIAPIALLFAKKHLFVHHLTLVHRLVSHSLVERYVEVILALLRHHPEICSLIDPQSQLYVCDLIKRIPESKPCKYLLLTFFVNHSFEKQYTMAKKRSTLHESFLVNQSKESFYQPTPQMDLSTAFNHLIDQALPWRAKFSTFQGEEELIIRASTYGLLATDTELRTREFNLYKRDSIHGQSLLMRLLHDELRHLESSGFPLAKPSDNMHLSKDYWKTYELFKQTMIKRVKINLLSYDQYRKFFRDVLEVEIIREIRLSPFSSSDNTNIFQIDFLLMHSWITRDMLYQGSLDSAATPRAAQLNKQITLNKNSLTIQIH